MTKDDIIRLAQEAELNAHGLVIDRLARFATLVAAAEREECAKEAELCIKTEPKVSIRAANAIAAAIRSRTNPVK